MGKKSIYILHIFVIVLYSLVTFGADFSSKTSADIGLDEDTTLPENPVTTQYLKKHLRKKSPRLILSPANEKILRAKLKTDPVVKNVYKAIRLDASEIQKEPLLERIMTGRRLLSVAAKMRHRMSILGMVYFIEKDSKVLQRINDEVVAVCNFTDWNPSHYLDVAEFSLAISLALDWTAGKLPRSTIELATDALIEKGIKPSYSDGEGNWWLKTNNNWNPVCHCGMIAASVAVAEKDPELAARTISRALNYMPNALKVYAPDGVYPEVPNYWEYGTGFTIIAASILESALGSDFGLTESPGFMESAVFKVLATAPSGMPYNFSDCGTRIKENGNIILAWFAMKTGNSVFLEKEKFLRPPEELKKTPAYYGMGLAWLAQIDDTRPEQLPLAWKGDGRNPIAIFRGGDNDPHQYYFGGKGGCGKNSHGNMDGGSFIFELNEVRWSIDLGTQSYENLEKVGFDLWSGCQDCDRWKLLTKNNFGHSTLTVNDQLHVVDSRATLLDFKDGDKPTVTIDMRPTYEGQLKSAERTFTKDSSTSLLIEDRFELSENTKELTWQLVTTADVYPEGGALLKQDGKELNLDILSPTDFEVSVISLCPAPLKLDKQKKGLKRIEIRMPSWIFEESEGKIIVRLSGK